MSNDLTPAPPLPDCGGAAGDSPTESSADPFDDPRVMLESMIEASFRMAGDMLIEIQGGAGDANPEGYALALRDVIRRFQTAEKDLLANETHTCFKGDI